MCAPKTTERATIAPKLASAFKRVILENPKPPSAHDAHGAERGHQQRQPRAGQRAAELLPDSANVFYMLALTLDESGVPLPSASTLPPRTRASLAEVEEFRRDSLAGRYYAPFMINSKKLQGINSALQLSGASVCVQSGTTTELNLADYFKA